ncbi:hypothetical protein IR083_09950 [Dysgonomonas sp. GY75]|uniref:hypothetical protein n=1 Tax=Dysgonomonas sp. GY75 TaxID=2780419 RepID=UPI0018845174|nr:hypothetical protein [Dysgonomonas sp. GY75]MBF0649142.1 hypothetical protein [Dysgonomonas sp. GY75]
MSKNILIRDLTEEQNKRLLQLQEKFGVKTNSQALLLLLQFCVITDDEITSLIEMYESFGITAFEGFKILEQVPGTKDQVDRLKTLTEMSINITRKLKYLMNLRKK